jgi:NRAMP (natural resistance-associated macrophage protein)-like metal ion transporter
MSLVQKICKSSGTKLCLFLATVGPGIVVMLADTDAGSIVTAAQSGAVFGYKLLFLQIILIPVLYLTQELTIRLGITTQKGFSELIKQQFGNTWAFISVGTLAILSVGAITTELSGIASIAIMLGIPVWLSMVVSIILLMAVVFTKKYSTLEKIAIAIGTFELVYLVVAFKAEPSLSEVASGFSNLPFANKNYLYLCAANIGAVIMPWMIFYQQSAIVDKKLTEKNLPSSRLETAFGAIITQVIMIAIIIATAATIGKVQTGAQLQSIQDISLAITPFLGRTTGTLFFALGLLGASLVATIVVSLSLAWSIGEIYGFKHSLQDRPKEAPWFYGIYFAILLIGAIIVILHTQLIYLNIAIEVLNALLLPIILTFLFLLTCKALPQKYKLRTWHSILIGIVFAAVSAVSLYTGIVGIMP